MLLLVPEISQEARSVSLTSDHVVSFDLEVNRSRSQHRAVLRDVVIAETPLSVTLQAR
jgi:hypothetical protein